MGESTRLENILNLVYDQIRQSYTEHDNDGNPEMCEVLCECEELCFKLLHFDYFKKSEEYISKEAEKTNVNNSKAFKKISSKWEKIYKNDLKAKQKDLINLFKLIVDYSEEL